MRIYCTFGCLALFVLSFFPVSADIIPADKSTLSYCDVYFETEFADNADEYELILYSDSLHAANDRPEKTLKGKLPAFYIKDLLWNSRYFWKVKTYDQSGKLNETGVLRQFRICPKVSYITFDEIKFDIKTNKPDKHSNGFISIDYTKAIIDRNGKTLWVVPELGRLQNKETQVRDLKLTKENTITFFSNNVPLEIDYEGNILWRLPNPFVFGKDTIAFHHDFKKTKDGHYFILGNKRVIRPLLGAYNEKQKTNKNLIYRNDSVFKRTEIAILFEFDQNGNVLWFWDANSYITDEDLNFKKNPGGFPIFLTHANGFSVNQSGTKIYLSFKELNRIVRIDKKSKKVDRSYGEKFPSGEAQFGDGFFMQQHDPNITERNTILFFNNNEVRNKTSISSIMEIKDDPEINDSLLRWKFDLNFDSLTKGKSVSGGNVVEMPDGNIFLCAGQLNRIFEINRNRDLVWDMFLYSKRNQDSSWMPFNQYRANWLPEFNSRHFLVKCENKNLTKGNKPNLTLTIFNTGTTGDTYKIRIETPEGKMLHEYTSDPVKQGDSAYLAFDVEKQKAKQLNLIITSKSSVFIKKVIGLTFN